MIKRFLHFRPKITELIELAKERGDIYQCVLAAYEVSDDQWEVLGDIREILATFEDPTLILQGMKLSTISLTIPRVYGVLEQLDAVLLTPDSNDKYLKKRNPYIARGVREAKKKILDYHPIYDEDVNSLKILNLVTAFDPRFKLEVFEVLGFSDTIIAEIKSTSVTSTINIGWSTSGVRKLLKITPKQWKQRKKL